MIRLEQKSYFQVVGTITYGEPQAPHIVIDRDDQATLNIKDVRREDEGTFKIEYILESDGTVVAEQRVNLTVLGNFSSVITVFLTNIVIFNLFASHFLSF